MDVFWWSLTGDRGVAEAEGASLGSSLSRGRSKPSLEVERILIPEVSGTS